MGSRVQTSRTNLVSFEANQIHPALDPSLHLGSQNHELSFELLI
jgi:hypothetical protein